MTILRSNRLSLLAAGAALLAPFAAAAQSAPDVRSYAPGFASPGVPMSGAAPRTAAVAPDARSYAPGFASAGVPMTEPGRVWTPRNDGSTASAGVPLREAPAGGNAVASGSGPR